MIKYSEIEEVFAQEDIKVYEYNIETNEEIDIPFVVYTATDGDSFQADAMNYFNVLTIALAMIDETLNFTLQRKIESVFDSNSTMYDKQINFDDESRLYSITYNFEVLDDGFDKDNV